MTFEGILRRMAQALTKEEANYFIEEMNQMEELDGAYLLSETLAHYVTIVANQP